MKTILADASEVSGALARKSDSFGRILDNIEEATFEMREASAGVNDLVTTLESNVGQLADSADATLSVARGTLTGLDQVVAQDLRLVPRGRAADRAVGHRDLAAAQRDGGREP